MALDARAHETFAQTLRRLQSAQKGRARGAPAYSVYVNRSVGRVLAAWAYRAGLTPNQVTGVSALFTFTGIALVALVPPSPGLGVTIAALLALGYAWDSADGQVARLRGGGSAAGEWLDHFVDAIKIATLHVAVLIGLAQFSEFDRAALLLPIAYSVVATVTFFGMILNDLLKSARGVTTTAARGGASPARSILLLPTDYGVLCLVFVAWGWPSAFWWIYGAMFAANALFLIAASVKWFREMRAIA